MDIVKYLKRVEKISIDNSPVILTVIGVTGVVATGYFAYRAGTQTPKVLQEVTENAWGEDREPTLQEKIKETYKFYIPAAVTGSLTCAAIVSANRIGSKRTAALAAAYTISERGFQEYRDKVIEKVGSTKEQAVRDEVAQDRVNRAGDATVFVGDGKVLCFDSFTGRYFQSTMEELRRAENIINSKMINGDQYASLSDYYEQVGLPATPMSEEVGWTVDRLLHVEVSATVTPDGRPCLVLDFSSAPTRGYHKFQ